MNITLIRHPQTKANKAHIIYGKTDYEYTERGKNQLLWIKDYMMLNYSMKAEFEENKEKYKIITSPRRRAKDLAMAISQEMDIGWEEEKLIGEMDFGIFEGLTTEEAKLKYPDEYFDFQYHFDTTAIPDGDSYEAFINRVNSFVDRLGLYHESGKYNELLIVTHGGVIRELFERLLEVEPGTSWKLLVGNGCILKLVLKKDGFHLRELIANKF